MTRFKRIVVAVAATIAISSFGVISFAESIGSNSEEIGSTYSADTNDVFYFNDYGGYTTNPEHQLLYVETSIRPVDLYGNPVTQSPFFNSDVVGYLRNVPVGFSDSYPTNVYVYTGWGAVYNGGHPYSGIRYSNSATYQP